MTHFQKSKLHTGLFADLTAETIGFTVHLPDVPDSDGTASEAGDTDQECFVPPDIGDEQSSDWSTEDAWEALREAEADEAWANLGAEFASPCR